MTQAQMTVEEKRIRLFIYEFVVRFDRCPTLNEIAEEAQLTPWDAQQVLQRLETVHSAIVLSPGSGNLWLADPFAALPTPFPVVAGEHNWFGMCVWDALGILVVADVGSPDLDFECRPRCLDEIGVEGEYAGRVSGLDSRASLLFFPFEIDMDLLNGVAVHGAGTLQDAARYYAQGS